MAEKIEEFKGEVVMGRLFELADRWLLAYDWLGATRARSDPMLMVPSQLGYSAQEISA